MRNLKVNTIVIATMALALVVAGIPGTAEAGVCSALGKPSGCVNSKDVKTDTLRGNDINEATLGTVPSANIANTANIANMVGGVTALPVFVAIPTDTGATTIFDLAGLKLTVACPSGSLTIAATTSANDAVFASQAQNFSIADGARSSDFDSGQTLNPIGAIFRGHVTLNYARLTGQVVTAALSVDDSNTFDSFDGCEVTGVVMSAE